MVTALQPELRKFSIAEYYKLAETGVLAPSERVELLNGQIIRMAATLNYDSDDKLRAYERGGIKEYWIIDVGKKTVNIYKFPSQEHNYARESHTYGVIAPQAFPDVTVDSQKSLSLDSPGRPIIGIMSPVSFTPEKQCYTVLLL